MRLFTIPCFLSISVFVQATYLREPAERIRHFDGKDPFTFQQAAQNPKAAELLAQLSQDPIDDEGKEIEEKTHAEQEALDELLDALTNMGVGSMPDSKSPSVTAVPTSAAKIVAPTASPSLRPSVPFGQTTIPTFGPTSAPSSSPSVSVQPSLVPTIAACGISAASRTQILLAILSNVVVDPSVLTDMNTSQGLATDWILNEDEAVICPDDEKFLQRWVLAVMYYSTGGDDWIQCSANPDANVTCGSLEPHLGESPFLSAGSECEWAGITCVDGCVTEIEFEENNLNGVIPTEIGLLKDLRLWGMERGGLTGTIPSEIGLLSNLVFLDLDFNQLTGSLPDELFSLTNLNQLDVNDNQLTGSINNLGVFSKMSFLQIHANDFTGTVASEIGNFTRLAAFTLHETLISGVMPDEVCNLFNSPGNLETLIADCDGVSPNIECDCCTDCRPS